MKKSLIYLVAFLSGMAGLGYQITWARMFAVGLGHEIASVLALITAFFSGLAIGSLLLDRRLALSNRPASWYVVLELVIAVWVVVTIGLIPVVNEWAFQWIGATPADWQHWLVAFALPLVALLPATVAMGATLPAMDRFSAPYVADQKIVGGLYGANTMGAVAGTILSAFFVNQMCGYRQSLFLFAGLNLICAAIVGVVFVRGVRGRKQGVSGRQPPCPPRPKERRSVKTPDPVGQNDVAANRAQAATHSPRIDDITAIALIAFAAGFLGIGYEVVGVRLLSAVFANTVYTYAATLSVFLMGTAIGGVLYQAVFRKWKSEPVLNWILMLTSLSCISGILVMTTARAWYRSFRLSWGDIVLSEFAMSVLVFAWPTIMMGLLFSHLAQLARGDRGGVGKVLAINTTGAALAPIWFGIIMVPELGLKWSLLAIAFGYLFLIPNMLRKHWLLPLAVIAFVLMSTLVRFEPITLRGSDVRLIEKPGVMASVAVVQDTKGHRSLRINNHYAMGGTSSPNFERTQGVIPLLLHEDPQQMLFLGVGTGLTLSAATIDNDVRITGIELIPEVIEVTPFFEPFNLAPSRHPRIELLSADARRFVRATKRKYDVIVGDLFHPGRDGAGSLYTVEHFQAIQSALQEDGVACVWIPSYQMESEVFRTVLRSYLQVFPDAVAFLGEFRIDHLAVALVSDARWLDRVETWWGERNIDSSMAKSLASLDLDDMVRLAGHLLADNPTLREYAGSGQINTDNWPVVTYRAPYYIFAGYPRKAERVFQILKRFDESRRQTLTQDLQPEFRKQLLQYWIARDHFLQAMSLPGERQRAELLQALQASDRFTAAYRRALSLAQQMAREDSSAQASRWLEQIIETYAEPTEARVLLNTIQRTNN